MNQFYNVFSALHKLETFYFVKIFLKLSDLQKKKKKKYHHLIYPILNEIGFSSKKINYLNQKCWINPFLGNKWM